MFLFQTTISDSFLHRDKSAEGEFLLLGTTLVWSWTSQKQKRNILCRVWKPSKVAYNPNFNCWPEAFLNYRPLKRKHLWANLAKADGRVHRKFVLSPLEQIGVWFFVSLLPSTLLTRGKPRSPAQSRSLRFQADGEFDESTPDGREVEIGNCNSPFRLGSWSG